MSTSNEIMKPVILCATAQGRAVIYGFVKEDPTPGQPVTVYNARMILEWRGSSGLFGVAAKGPEAGSRITAAVPRLVENVWAQCLDVTPEAAAKLAAWPAV